MKSLTTLVASFLFAASASTAFAAKDPKNLTVLSSAHSGKEVEKGMKELSKGLGVKCTACHAKGDFAADAVGAKEDARRFLAAVVGTTDTAKRGAALQELAKSLKIDAVKKPEKVWKGVDRWKKP